MDTLVKVKCIDQTLTIMSSPIIASGGVDENKVEFDFDSKWDGFTKTAIFYQDKKNVYYSLVGTDNTCIIPKEATLNKGTMFFGVFGVNGDVIKTSEIVRYRIEQGAITEDIKPSDPTPELWQQVLELSSEMAQNAANLIEQQSEYETTITKQQNTYEATITKQQTEYETSVNEKLTNQKTTSKLVSITSNMWNAYNDMYRATIPWDGVKSTDKVDFNLDLASLDLGSNMKSITESAANCFYVYSSSVIEDTLSGTAYKVGVE